MAKNTLHELRTLEKYFTDMFMDIHSDNSKILWDKDNVFAQKVLSKFVNEQINKIKEQIKRKHD